MLQLKEEFLFTRSPGSNVVIVLCVCACVCVKGDRISSMNVGVCTVSSGHCRGIVLVTVNEDVSPFKGPHLGACASQGYC